METFGRSGSFEGLSPDKGSAARRSMNQTMAGQGIVGLDNRDEANPQVGREAANGWQS
jgi:hypothetical protein